LEKQVKEQDSRQDLAKGTSQIAAIRAVKQIDLDSRFGPIDYNRELEAIAKFSHSRASLANNQFVVLMSWIFH
jgi:hypothetical protein